MSRNNKLYNYIVNTLGISKEMVNNTINERIEQIVEKTLKNLLDSNYFKQLILDKTTQIIQEGVNTSRYTKDSFNNFVRVCIRDEITKQVNDNFELEVKIVKKDQKLLHKISGKPVIRD